MTPLGNDCDMTISDLQNASPETRDEILKGIAKTKAFDLISSQRILNRTSRYLDEKQRAVRKLQGLEMGTRTEEEEKVVLGDNDESVVTHNHSGMLGTGAAAVLSTAIAAGAALGWKMLDEPTPTPVTPTNGESGFNADVIPGFGTPEYYNPQPPNTN